MAAYKQDAYEDQLDDEDLANILVDDGDDYVFPMDDDAGIICGGEESGPIKTSAETLEISQSEEEDEDDMGDLDGVLNEIE